MAVVMEKTDKIEFLEGSLCFPEFDLILERLNKLPSDTKSAILSFTNILSEYMSPIIAILKKKLERCENLDDEEVFFLCHNLILKYTNVMVDIFKEETDHSCVLQESRNWATLRIVWCLEKLKNHNNKHPDTFKCRMPSTPSNNYFEASDGDEFITWVDDALDLLDVFSKLFQDDSEKFNLQNGKADTLKMWENECCTALLKLRGVIRELVAAAMKICQNCLTSDQSIIIARCHVVFRESKTLMEEIFTTDLSMVDGIDSRKMKLKEDPHYPTVRLLNDVLRDAIYNLEACINKAVLGLVLNCMVYPVEPLQRALREQLDNRNRKHFATSDSTRCVGELNQDQDFNENEHFIEEFDIHNERLLQIGLFAVSCSADKQRISMLKSSLASLEALEPHLVPSFLSDPASVHSQILANHWTHEINSLRALVFLIIDPVALIELVMEKYRSQLMEMKKDASLRWDSVQHLIGLGKSVLDFIQIYAVHEPTSFPQLEKLSNYVVDLRKVLKECRVISDLFLRNPDLKTATNDGNEQMIGPIQSGDQKHKEIRILKRLKLLYALLLNISKQIIGEHSLEDEEQSGEEDQSDKEVNIERAKNNIENQECNMEKDVTRIIPVKLRSNSRVPQRNKGILGILQNFKGNIRHGTLFGWDALNKDRSSQSCSPGDNNKTFPRSYIARKTCNYKRRDTSQQRISKMLNYQSKRSVSALVLNTEGFLLANISAQDQTSVMHHITGLTDSAQFTDEYSKRVISLLNENSKTTRKHRRSLRKQLLKNQVASNKLRSPVSNYSHSKESNKRDCKSLNLSVKNSESSVIDWHITEILEQLTGLSDTLSLLNIDRCEDNTLPTNNAQKHETANKKVEGDIAVIQHKHIVTLKINDPQLCSPKKVWNIKVDDNNSYTPKIDNSNSYTSKIDINSCIPKDDNNSYSSKTDDSNSYTPKVDGNIQLSNSISCEIDVSFGSNIATPERMNDINQLEQKLANLRDFWK